MGAMLAATMQAPLMSIMMVFEMTMDYKIVLPLMLAMVTAHYTVPRYVDVGPTYAVPQITNCDPSSTTRLAGIWKKSLALVAFLVRKAKRRARKGHMCWVLVNTMDSRER